MLRWHPWAPLVAGLLLVAFAFVLGLRWGYHLGTRVAPDYSAFSSPGREWVKFEREPRQPAFQTFASARSFDAVVVAWAREQDDRARPSKRLQFAIEDRLFLRDSAFRDGTARHWAEYRLKTLSGNAPHWQRTANVCQELGAGFDVRDEVDRAAKAYTRLLGREIRAEQLAPLSGAVCN